MMLDWFSAHLHEDVRRLIVEEKGHCLLFHGGGVTGILQPNDTHDHEPLSKEFKRLADLGGGKAPGGLKAPGGRKRTASSGKPPVAQGWLRPRRTSGLVPSTDAEWPSSDSEWWPSAGARGQGSLTGPYAAVRT